MEILTKHEIFGPLPPSGHFRKNYYENTAWQDTTSVIGIDEAGRGCLAGPVVIAAAIVPINTTYRGLRDSKLLSVQARLKAFHWIMRKCITAVSYIDPYSIDIHNIYYATRQGMKRVALQLLHTTSQCPVGILVDAMPISFNFKPIKPLWIRSFPKAESKSVSVAAASIVAKVMRDQLMSQSHTLFPSYGLNQHKGYATSLHQKQLLQHGCSLIHRKTFVKTSFERHDNSYEQRTIC